MKYMPFPIACAVFLISRHSGSLAADPVAVYALPQTSSSTKSSTNGALSSSNSKTRMRAAELHNFQRLNSSISLPKDPGWFGAFSEGESTFDEDADYRTHRDAAPWVNNLDGWNPPMKGDTSGADFFHESPSAAWKSAWQTHYPAIQSGVAGQGVNLGPWYRGTGGSWNQDYRSGYPNSGSTKPAAWFDSAVNQIDGYGRPKEPYAGTGRRYEMWREQSVNTTISCADPGCVANASLQAFNGRLEQATRCRMNFDVHATDFDEDWSGEKVEWIYVNNALVNQNCTPRASGCAMKGMAGIALYNCVLELPLDMIITWTGTLSIGAKISSHVDECPFQGNMLAGVVQVTCMVTERNPSPLFDGRPTYPGSSADSSAPGSGDGSSMGTGGSSGADGSGDGDASGADGTGADGTGADGTGADDTGADGTDATGAGDDGSGTGGSGTGTSDDGSGTEPTVVGDLLNGTLGPGGLLNGTGGLNGSGILGGVNGSGILGGINGSGIPGVPGLPGLPGSGGSGNASMPGGNTTSMPDTGVGSAGNDTGLWYPGDGLSGTTTALVTGEDGNTILRALAPLQCTLAGCEAEEELLLTTSDDTKFGSCQMSVYLNQTDFDGGYSSETVEYVALEGNNISTNIAPGKNPCHEEMAGTPLPADQIPFALVTSYDVTAQANAGKFTVSGKLSPKVDECASNGRLFDGWIIVDCTVNPLTLLQKRASLRHGRQAKHLHAQLYAKVTGS